MKNSSGWVLECQRMWTVENVAFWTSANALQTENLSHGLGI